MNITDDAFIELLAARTLTVQGSASSLNSLRIMLYRKLQAHIEQWDSIGYLTDELRDTTISAQFFVDHAIFSIVKRKPRLQFTILRADQVAPHEKVSTDLGWNKESQIQHGSSNSNPQEHGTHADSGSEERESNGQCSPEEDWQSVVRKFIEQDSSGSEKP